MKKLIILIISLFVFVNFGGFVSEANAQSVSKKPAHAKPKKSPSKASDQMRLRILMGENAADIKLVEDKKCAEIIMDSDGVLHSNWINRLIQSKYNINCTVYRTIHKDEWDEPTLIQLLPESSEEEDEEEEDESKYDKKILSRTIHLVDLLLDYENLIAAGADVNLPDERGQTIFFNTKIFAEADPEDEEIYDIFRTVDVNVNVKDKAGQTALSMAIPWMLMNVYSWEEDGLITAQDVDDEEGSAYTKNFTGHYNYIKWLLKQGASVKGGKEKSKALLKLKPEQFVKEIVKVGWDINSRDIDGYTALHKLVRHKVSDMPMRKRSNNKSKKYRYVNTELYDPIKLLLNSGAKANVRDAMGRTPLHYAQNPHVIQALLKAGAKLNEADNEGQTPLHLAVTMNASAFDELLKACPDSTIKDKNGKTALDIAVLSWQKESLELYNKLGCKAYQKTAAKRPSTVNSDEEELDLSDL